MGSRWRVTLLLVVDALLILGSFLAAFWLRFGPLAFLFEKQTVFFERYQLIAPFVVVIYIFSMAFYGLYRQGRYLSAVEKLIATFKAVLVGTLVMIMLPFLIREQSYSRGVFALFFLLALPSLSFWRIAAHYLRRWVGSYGLGLQPVVIIGGGRLGSRIIRELKLNPDYGYIPLAVLDDAAEMQGGAVEEVPVRGRMEDLPGLLEKEKVADVILAIAALSTEKMMSVITICDRFKVPVKIIPNFFEVVGNKAQFTELAGMPVINIDERVTYGWGRATKRAFDIFGSLFGIILLSPFFLWWAIRVRLDSKGPVFFRQERVSRGFKHFYMYKFRSMYIDAEARLEEVRHMNESDGPIFKMRNDPRITRYGKFLRRFSIDEMPQLFNVLLGQMSLVGPRPPIPAEVEEYEEWQKRRLSVSPGMTGLWQVSGRSELSFDEMVRLDIYYIENWTLWQDFVILLKTIPRVLGAKGAY